MMVRRIKYRTECSEISGIIPPTMQSLLLIAGIAVIIQTPLQLAFQPLSSNAGRFLPYHPQKTPTRFS